MSNPISFCDECFTASYPECDDITFVVGLTPSTGYTATITNHFDQEYFQDVTTDTGGAFSLDITKFPEGFFNPFSGFFTLTVQKNGVAKQLSIQYSFYDCITFDIFTSTDAN